LISSWVSGIYPRSESLIEATRTYDKDLKQLFKKEKIRSIKHQINNKCDYISDPLIDWDDNLRPFTDNIKGIERGALSRYYENNTFYRQPVIIGNISSSGKILKNNINFELFSKKSKVKIDVLDPFTLADLSKNNHYKSKIDLANGFGKILRKELTNIKNKVDLIQFNAPSLAKIKQKEQIQSIKQIMDKTTKGLNVKTCLNLCGSDISNNIKNFIDFNVDIIGIDFINTKSNKLQAIEIDKTLACGIIDAKNTKMENPTKVINEIKLINKLFKPKSIAIIPNWDFEFIPLEFTYKKIRIMNQIKMKGKGINL
tara:strand:+ start:7922 stop:8860 length:939 start_codon:yes stop_codon:yes gene_type:complete